MVNRSRIGSLKPFDLCLHIWPIHMDAHTGPPDLQMHHPTVGPAPKLKRFVVRIPLNKTRRPGVRLKSACATKADGIVGSAAEGDSQVGGGIAEPLTVAPKDAAGAIEPSSLWRLRAASSTESFAT